MTKSSITGARDRLVQLLRRRLTKDAVGEAKLTVYTAEPTPDNGQALHGHLVEAGVDQDHEILTLARDLLAAAGPTATGPGSLVASIIQQVVRDQATAFQGGHHTHNYAAKSTAQVRWEILPVRGQLFELRNIGEATARDVTITAENAVRFDPPAGGQEWGPGSGKEFFAVGSMQTGHPTVAVSWLDETGERRAWSRPLPR